MYIEKFQVLSLEVWGQEEKPSKMTERGGSGVGLVGWGVEGGKPGEHGVNWEPTKENFMKRKWSAESNAAHGSNQVKLRTDQRI